MGIIESIIAEFAVATAIAAAVWWFVPRVELRTVFRQESLPRALGFWAILTFLSLPIGTVVVITAARFIGW